MHERHVPASVTALLAITALAAPIALLAIWNRADDPVVVAHRERQAAITDSSQDILNRAEAEKRDLTTEEKNQVKAMADEFDDLEEQIALRERISNQTGALRQPAGRRTDPEVIEDPAAPAPRAAGARAEPRPRPATARGNGGFRSFGEFACVVKNQVLGASDDNRLRNASATTYGSEGTGADGGFSVPPDFAAEISSKVFAEDSLVGRCDDMPTSSNTMNMPTDMTTPWDSTGGIQAYWDGEARAMTQSKPSLEEVTTKAHKLHCLVPVTEELLEDSPAMDAYLRRKAPEKMDFKISYAIAWGSGAGMPLGFMNSPCLVTQAAESAQTTDTINQPNISKMWSRMPIQSRLNAVWLIHPDAEPQLDALTVGTVPVYMPPGGLSDSPYGRLKGRPVIPHQICETVGDLGDIMLVDLKQYMALKKIGGGRDANGFKAETSIHLWFDQDLTAFKFTFRLGGQPWWSKATSPRDGSNTQSPFVTLASR